MIEVRILRPDEIPAEANVPNGAVAVGAIEDDKVVALLGAFTMVFLDPLWVAPDRRRDVLSHTLLRQLWAAMKSLLVDANIRITVGHVDQTQPVMAMLLRRIGGQEVFGKRQFVVKLEE